MASNISDLNLELARTASYNLQNYVGVRIRFRWIGTKRQLNDVAETIASSYESDPEMLTVSKCIVPADNQSYKKLIKIRNKIRGEWLRRTLPSLDYGVRLIRKELDKDFQDRMHALHTEFVDAVEEFDRNWDQIKEEMKTRLGSLYKEEDYVLRPKDVIRFIWEFVSLQLPSFLREEVYREELEKYKEKMDATVSFIRLSLITEFSNLVNNLLSKLNPSESGEKKRFKRATLENIKEFIEGFRNLVGLDDPALNQLVQKAEEALNGVDINMLKTDSSVRNRIRSEFDNLAQQIAQLSQTVTAGRKIWI